MQPRRWVVVAVTLAGCGQGRKAEPAAAGAPADATLEAARGDAWLRAPDPTPAQAAALASSRSLRCLLARDARLDGFTPDLTPALAAVVTRAVVDAVRDDGDGPVHAAWARAAQLHAAIDDRAGLRAAVAAHDRIELTRDELGDRLRALGGASVAPPTWLVDLEVIRDLALAGDGAGATARYARPEAAAKPDEESFYAVRRLQALVAMGRDSDAQALVDAAAPRDRLELLGAWLEVALTRDAGVPAAVEALAAALDAAAPGSGLTWDPEPGLRLARRHQQGAAMARLRPALTRVLSADQRGYAGTVLEDALVARDEATADRAGRLVAPAWRAWLELLYRAPIADAIAAVRPADTLERTQLIRLWVRHAAEGGAPAVEALLTERACAGQPPDVAVAGPPAPALAGAQVVARDQHPRALRACAGIEAEVRLTADGREVARQRFDGACSGACDAAAQRDGQATLDAIQARVDRGDATQSETDYDFTSCMWSGTRVGRRARIAERDVVILVERYIGPHDAEQDQYAIATEVCGALYVSPSFGAGYARDFALDALVVAAARDGRQLVVTGARDDWRGVLLRLTLPGACPGAPVAEVIDSGS